MRLADCKSHSLYTSHLTLAFGKPLRFRGPHEIIVRPKGDKNFVSECVGGKIGKLLRTEQRRNTEPNAGKRNGANLNKCPK